MITTTMTIYHDDNDSNDSEDEYVELNRRWIQGLDDVLYISVCKIDFCPTRYGKWVRTGLELDTCWHLTL